MKPDAVAAVAVGDFNHAAELKCQGRALTFPGNPTPCPLSAGEQRTQKGAGQGELCHRDEGWGEGQREGGWCRSGTTEKELRGRWKKTESDLRKKTKRRYKTEVESDQWQRVKRGTGGCETEDRKGEQDRKKWVKMAKKRQEHSINQTPLTN